MYLKAKISKEDGTNIVKGVAVCPINLTLQSLWSQIDIKISGQSLSLSNNTYPYKAYFQTLLKTSSDAKDTQLTSQMFYLDNNDLDKCLLNTGALQRLQLFEESESVEMEGPL